MLRSLRILAALCLCLGVTRAGAEEVLTPTEAAKQEGKGKTVTVEFVVQSCHSVPPDGKHFRLFSEPSFKDRGAFIVHLTQKAVTKLAVQDLEKHFLGKKVRATGKVEKTVFSSFPETRPGIVVDDAALIEKPCACSMRQKRSLVPALCSITNASAMRRRWVGVTWLLQPRVRPP
jgi:hypothetical protein